MENHVMRDCGVEESRKARKAAGKRKVGAGRVGLGTLPQGYQDVIK